MWSIILSYLSTQELKNLTQTSKDHKQILVELFLENMIPKHLLTYLVHYVYIHEPVNIITHVERYGLDNFDNTVLISCIYHNNLGIFKYFHDKGYNIHFDRDACLYFAVSQRKTDIVNYLVDCGAVLDVKEIYRPLFFAVQYVYNRVVQCLINNTNESIQVIVASLNKDNGVEPLDVLFTYSSCCKINTLRHYLYTRMEDGHDRIIGYLMQLDGQIEHPFGIAINTEVLIEYDNNFIIANRVPFFNCLQTRDIPNNAMEHEIPLNRF